jgi:hypothetical protein
VIDWLNSTTSTHVERDHIVDAGACLGATIKNIQQSTSFSHASAIGLKRPPNAVTGINYSVGDMQNRAVYKDLQPVNLIVSQMALMHMVDPYAAIELMGNCLKSGGTMLLQLPTPGKYTKATQLSLPTLLPIVHKAGLVVEDICESGWPRVQDASDFNDVMLVRDTNDPVRFDVEYSSQKVAFDECIYTT